MQLLPGDQLIIKLAFMTGRGRFASKLMEMFTGKPLPEIPIPAMNEATLGILPDEIPTEVPAETPVEDVGTIPSEEVVTDEKTPPEVTNVKKSSMKEDVRNEDMLVGEFNRLSGSARRVRDNLKRNQKGHISKHTRHGNEDFIFDDMVMPMGPAFSILPPYIQM